MELRNIPACTGKTKPAAKSPPTSTEHPRLHGENFWCIAQNFVQHGTSPPARGKRPRSAARGTQGRNIPACTGKTRSFLTITLSPTEHPRLHGENSRLRARLAKSRNIPACTGKTLPLPCAKWGSSEHPRLHGENWHLSLKQESHGGTSPPARGKHFGATSPSPVYTLRGLRKPS